MPELVYWMTRREWHLLNTPQHIGCLQHFAIFWTIVRISGDSGHQSGILPVGSFVIHLLRTALSHFAFLLAIAYYVWLLLANLLFCGAQPR